MEGALYTELFFCIYFTTKEKKLFLYHLIVERCRPGSSGDLRVTWSMDGDIPDDGGDDGPWCQSPLGTFRDEHPPVFWAGTAVDLGRYYRQPVSQQTTN